MKFKKEIEIEIGEWSEDHLYAWEGPWNHYIKHERDIPQEWPRDAINYATQVIHENRELEKDETRLIDTGEIVKMLKVKGSLIMTSAGGYLLHCNLPERLAFIAANKPKEWTVSEWMRGAIRITSPLGVMYIMSHERYIGDWPKEIQDLARKRIIANRPIEAHEFRPVDVPETIETFKILGLSVNSSEHCLGFEDVRAGNTGLCIVSEYLPNALRMTAHCREQPEYKAWLKEHQRTHSELGEDGVLRFVDDQGDENEVRAVAGERYEWRWYRGVWSDWGLGTLERVSHCCLGIQRRQEAIRKLCADWEKVNAIEDVTTRRSWPVDCSALRLHVPSQFQGRKFTVTYSDAGPIGGES